MLEISVRPVFFFAAARRSVLPSGTLGVEQHGQYNRRGDSVVSLAVVISSSSLVPLGSDVCSPMTPVAPRHLCTEAYAQIRLGREEFLTFCCKLLSPISSPGRATCMSLMKGLTKYTSVTQLNTPLILGLGPDGGSLTPRYPYFLTAPGPREI